MRRVIFHRATDLAHALALAEEHAEQARLLAGGTDLIVALRQDSRSLEPLHLIDLTSLARGAATDSLGAIEDNQAEISIGALVTHTQITQSPLLHRAAPLLAQACAQIGSLQIRNRGTIGGNLCNASPCADSAPALIALGAELILQSTRGERCLPLSAALLAPYKTALAPGEILTRIRFRRPVPDARMAFIKLGRRNAVSVSRMSIAVTLRQDAQSRMQEVRIAAGSVAPTPQRFPEIEQYLSGHAPSPERFAEAGRQLSARMVAACGRRWSTPYKQPVAEALLARALEQALEETRQNE